jgi:hypothetical protein
LLAERNGAALDEFGALKPPLRHARPCAGHPRLDSAQTRKDVDDRDKPGHDDCLANKKPGWNFQPGFEFRRVRSA